MPSGLKPDGSKADVPADPEFLPTLFKTEMGEDSDPSPTKAGDYFVAHVNGVTPPKLKPTGPGARPGHRRLDQ